MFTTGSKLFLGATALVDRGRRHLRQRQGRCRGLARRASVCSRRRSRSPSCSASTTTPTTATSRRCRRTPRPMRRPRANRPQRSMWPALAAVGVGSHRRRCGVEADRVQGRRRPVAGRRDRVGGAELERASLGRRGVQRRCCASVFSTRSSSRSPRRWASAILIYSFSR